MNILIIFPSTDEDPSQSVPILQAASEFGRLYVIIPQSMNTDSKNTKPTLTELTSHALRHRFPDIVFFQIDHASLSDCVRLAFTTHGWLPPIDIVIIGSTAGLRSGIDALIHQQTQAAFVAYEMGVPALSLFIEKTVQMRWEIVSYCTERLLRTILALPRTPHVVFHINIPNVRPNECEGFTFVNDTTVAKSGGTTVLDRSTAPWKFSSVDLSEIQSETVGWAIEHKMVAIELLWGWRSANISEQLEVTHLLSSAFAKLGTSRPYRVAVERAINHSVKYEYCFKGAVASTPSFFSLHPASAYASDIDPFFEEPILKHVYGRVLDVGCGSGRIASYLTTKHHEQVKEVVGIDSNPMSLEDYKNRWDENLQGPCITYCMDVRDINFESLGMFDTILLIGDTLGIPGDAEGVVGMLKTLRKHTQPGGLMIATGRDPARMPEPSDQIINAENLQAGFSSGERYLRIVFENHDTGWFRWFYMGLNDLRNSALMVGWKMLDTYTCLGDPDHYGVILQAQ